MSVCQFALYFGALVLYLKQQNRAYDKGYRLHLKRVLSIMYTLAF